MQMSLRSCSLGHKKLKVGLLCHFKTLSSVSYEFPSHRIRTNSTLKVGTWLKAGQSPSGMLHQGLFDMSPWKVGVKLPLNRLK